MNDDIGEIIYFGSIDHNTLVGTIGTKMGPPNVYGAHVTVYGPKIEISN